MKVGIKINLKNHLKNKIISYCCANFFRNLRLLDNNKDLDSSSRSFIEAYDKYSKYKSTYINNILPVERSEYEV